MTTVTRQDVEMIAPELGCGAIDPDVWSLLISNALVELGSSTCIDAAQSKMLAVLLVADKATQFIERKNGGASSAKGPMTGVTVGSVSKSFSDSRIAGMAAASSLGLASVYGREFLRLSRLWGARVVLV